MNSQQSQTIRLLIANDQQVVLVGLQTLCSKYTEIVVVDHARSIPETLRLVGEYQPDVVLLEPFMHGQDGLQAISLMRGEWPDVALVVFTTHQHNDEHMLRALRAGVRAYLTSDCTYFTLLNAIHAAARGETLLRAAHVACLLATHEVICVPGRADKPVNEGSERPVLTAREREVLQRVTYGERNKEIAAQLAISEPTVKTHLANIFYKLGVDSRAAAVAVALEGGMLSGEGDKQMLPQSSKLKSERLR